MLGRSNIRPNKQKLNWGFFWGAEYCREEFHTNFTGIFLPTPWSFFARTDKSQAAQWQDPPRVWRSCQRELLVNFWAMVYKGLTPFGWVFGAPNIPTTSIWKFKDNQILATTVRIPESQRGPNTGRQHRFTLRNLRGNGGNMLGVKGRYYFEPSIEVKLSHSCSSSRVITSLFVLINSSFYHFFMVYRLGACWRQEFTNEHGMFPGNTLPKFREWCESQLWLLTPRAKLSKTDLVHDCWLSAKRRNPSNRTYNISLQWVNLEFAGEKETNKELNPTGI